MKNKKITLLILILLTINKIVITTSLPMFIESAYRYDDVLMMDMASSLINGNWLGIYSEITLTKGFFYPMFIAALKVFNIPYLLGLTLFYTFSTALFCYAIKDFFKNKIYVYLIYVLLLLEPITYSLNTFQRIYRNSLGTTLVLLVLASFLMLYKYQKNNNKKMIIWSVISGFTLSMFFFTREDVIWIIPFIVFVLVESIIFFIRNNKKRMIFISLMPFIILFLNINIVSFINYKQYGIYTINELTNSSFTKAYKKILSVEQNEYLNRVSVPKTTLDKIRKISPTFNSIGDELYKSNWVSYDKGEISDGYLFWALRDVASKEGYYKNSNTSRAFWNRVSTEIEEGIKKTKTKKRIIMPSSYISPYRNGYLEDTTNNFLNSVMYISKHKDLGAINKYSYDRDNLDRYEKILNDNFSNKNNRMDFETSVKMTNIVTKIYKIIFPIISILGIMSYILLIIKKHKDSKKILFLTAILFSYIFLLLGVSYTHVSAFDSISYYYLAPAYILQLVFCLVSFFLYLESLKVFGGKE